MQFVVGVIHAAVEYAIDDLVRGASGIDLPDAQAVMIDLIAGDEEGFLRCRFDAVDRIELDRLAELVVGDHHIVLAAIMHVVDRDVDLLWRAVLLGTFEHEEAAFRVDQEGQLVGLVAGAGLCCIDPQSFPCRITGNDFIARG